MREVSGGLYHEGLDLSMRDVAGRSVACTTGSVSTANTRPERRANIPGSWSPSYIKLVL